MGGALGDDGGHEQVLRRADAGELEHHMASDKPVGRARDQHAVVDLELDAEGLKAHQVHVDLTCADLASARHGLMGLPEAGDERTENRDARAHFGNQLVGRLETVDGRGVDDEIMPPTLDACTKAGKNLGHDLDIRDNRNVVKGGLAASEQRSRYQLERGVLSPRHAHVPAKRVVATHDDDFLSHDISSKRLNVAPARPQDAADPALFIQQTYGEILQKHTRGRASFHHKCEKGGISFEIPPQNRSHARARAEKPILARLFAEGETHETLDGDGAAESLGALLDVLSDRLVGVLDERLLGEAVLLEELLETAGSHLLLDVLGLAGLGGLSHVDGLLVLDDVSRHSVAGSGDRVDGGNLHGDVATALLELLGRRGRCPRRRRETRTPILPPPWM